MERFGNWTVESKIRDTPYGELLQVSHEERDDRATLMACHLDDQQLRSRFLLWGDALAQLKHASIVSVAESGLAFGGVPFCVVDGDRKRTLTAILEKELPDRIRALKILSSVVEAMSEAHRQEIMHGMLGAGAVLVEGDRVRVADLGFWSMVLEPAGLASKALREDNAAYLAPEQVAGKKVDGKADVFAFGLLACELLGGHHPYRGESTGETLRAILQAPIPRLVDPPYSLPGPMAALVTRCLRKDSADRIADFEPIRRALDRFLDPFLVVDEVIAETLDLEETETFTELESGSPLAPSSTPPAQPTPREISKPISKPVLKSAPTASSIPSPTPGPTPNPSPEPIRKPVSDPVEPEPQREIAASTAPEEETPEKRDREDVEKKEPQSGSAEWVSSVARDDQRGLVTQPIRPVAGGWERLADEASAGGQEGKSDSPVSANERGAEESSKKQELASEASDWSEELGASMPDRAESQEEPIAATVKQVSTPPPTVGVDGVTATPTLEVEAEDPTEDVSSTVSTGAEEVPSTDPSEGSEADRQDGGEVPPASGESRRWLWGLVAVLAVVVVAVLLLKGKEATEPEIIVEQGSIDAAAEMAIGRRLQAAGVALERGDREKAIDAVLRVLEDEPDREEAIGILGRVVEASSRAAETARTDAEAAGASQLVPLIVTQADEKREEGTRLLDGGEWELGVRELESAAELYRLAEKQAEVFAKPVENQDEARERELLLSAEADDVESMTELLETGSGVWGEPERKALRLAIAVEHVAVVRVMLESLPEEPDLGILLLDAALDGKPGLVEVLLDLGANIEVRDPLGRTPLLQAAADGHPITAGVLLGRGADIDARDDLGRSAKELAARRGHPGVLEVLRSHKAD